MEFPVTVDGTSWQPLDHSDCEPLWATAAQLEPPVMLHPVYNAAHSGLADWYLQNAVGNALIQIAGIDREHPDYNPPWES